MNISRLDKAEVLAALYNNAKVQGMGIFQANSKTMTTEEARVILDESSDKYFDYVFGRVMKVSLANDELETWLYNRDNGDGAAEKVIGYLNTFNSIDKPKEFTLTKNPE
jgi:hypothetical protein